MRILAVSGRKHSGKSTVAHAAMRRFGGVVMSFAQPIKEIGGLLGCSWSSMHHDKTQITPFGMDGRAFLQRMGTEAGRNSICDDIWLRVAALRLAKIARFWPGDLPFDAEGSWLQLLKVGLRSASGVVAFDDVRFPNEVEFLESMGAITVRLTRCVSGDSHISETVLDEWKFEHIVPNHRLSVDETNTVVAAILEKAGW